MTPALPSCDWGGLVSLSLSREIKMARTIGKAMQGQIGHIILKDIDGNVLAEDDNVVGLVMRDLPAAAAEENMPANMICVEHNVDVWAIPGHNRTFRGRFGRMLAKAYLARTTGRDYYKK